MTKLTLELKIIGQPFSKANSRRLVSTGGKYRSIKSEKALGYEEHALWQLKAQLGKHDCFAGPVRVDMMIYYPTMRQDLDPSLILDVMQKAGVYQNDRQVHELHLYRKLDRYNPRSEIIVEGID